MYKLDVCTEFYLSVVFFWRRANISLIALNVYHPPVLAIIGWRGCAANE